MTTADTHVEIVKLQQDIETYIGGLASKGIVFNYEDKEEPAGSYFGPGRCVGIYNTDRAGNPITALYEFEHPDEHGELTLSVFYANEIVMETSRP